MSEIKWSMNALPKSSDKDKRLDFLSEKEIRKATDFHESVPEYKETPLVSLNRLAEAIGLKDIYSKDESYRFGLNAFKVLGGSFAMAKYLAEKLGKDIAELSFSALISDEIKEKLGEVTFVTATDGNHGRGVAWTANRLKQKSVVYMPKGSSETRLSNIRAEGSDASITDMNYDDAVRYAANFALENDGVIVQDTAWEGYEKIPAWIMQGYGTMALEALCQMRQHGCERPTHIFVQAGVGSMAAAVQGFFAAVFSEDCPITVVVESDLADCFYKSAEVCDGNAYAVGGDMQTLMAGLACGEANTVAWEILKNYSSAFVSCPDRVSANGMRIYSSPLDGDTRVVSGESGAVTLGLLYEIMRNPQLSELKEKLCLDRDSRVLLFSTEGDTDPDMYKDIVWFGRNKK